MTKYRGTLVRASRKHVYNWSEEYRGQVFLVTDVIVNEEGRWTYRLLDHIGGGFIWASPLEVSRVRTDVKKESQDRRPREDREYAKVLGIYGSARKVRHRD